MSKTKQITFASFFLTLGLLLPFMTMQIPSIGNMLLPMHIPVIICGFLLGEKYGLLVGFLTPLLRSMLFSAPPIIAALPMAFELCAYGYLSGMLYHKTKNVYFSLIISMILGRVIWGVASLIIYGIQGTQFSFSMFLAGAFTAAIPGIVLQIILIPIIVINLKKGKQFNE